MTPENLTLILEALETLGGDAKDAFLLYICFFYGYKILFVGGMVWLGFYAVRQLTSFLRMLPASETLSGAYGGYWTAARIAHASEILRNKVHECESTK